MVKTTNHIEEVIDLSKRYMRVDELNDIRYAYKFAKEAHKNQKRFSGEPYIIHPVETAKILLKLGLKIDKSTVIACLLHDVVEDTPINIEEINKKFGDDIALLVNGMNKVEKVRFQGRERQIESLRKMFVAMAQDVRVIFIKLADRIHNLRTLRYVRPDKQKRIAQESLEIYASVAHRLGIHFLKDEIEDLCFKSLYPYEYRKIKQEVVTKTRISRDSIKEAKKKIKKILDQAEIGSTKISGRIKRLYSAFSKIKRKNLSSINEIYDLIAIRIVTKEVSDCYKILGIIHNTFTPIPHRFKDYISIPKQNGYQSLHTTIIGLVEDFPIEIQIRTDDMDLEAEYGLAIHWYYKEESQKPKIIPEKFAWLKSVAELHKKLKDTNEYIESIKLDIFSDKIFLLTPRGDVRILPNGSTAIDFAYSIHSDIGNQCIAAKANDKIVPLDEPLRSGQIIEIITRKNGSPKREWISTAKTSEAKTKIKTYFNALNKEKVVTMGRKILNKQLSLFGKEQLDNKLTILKNIDDQELSMKDRENILIKVGNGTLTASGVVKKIFKAKDIFNKRKVKQEVAEDTTTNVIVAGIKDSLTKLGKCCKPSLKNKKIVGYATRGLYVTIHNQNCKILKKLDKNRFLEASWAEEKSNNNYFVNLTINFTNRIGIIRDISTVVTNNNTSILEVKTALSKGESQATLIFKLEVQNIDTVQKITGEIEKMEGFISIQVT